MPSLLCQLNHVKAQIAGVTTSNALDADYLRTIEEVSAEFEGATGRSFQAVTATRYYDAPKRTPNQLWLTDDLLSITTLKVDQDNNGTWEKTLVADTDYWLHPDNSTPKYRIDLNPNGVIAEWPQGRRRIQIVGQFGYSNETEATGQTVQNTTQIAAGATSLTVTSTAGISTGETLVIETEQLYVSAIASPTALTVLRGQNGTTDAAHLTGVAIYRRRYPRDIEDGVKERVVGLRWDAQSGYAGSATLIGDATGAAGTTQIRASYARWRNLIGRYRTRVA